ncbi:hypothetical protein CC78DRAFT_535669 [Lojkania enalia]|uniref:Uncharacterized protein n=1 Tax=Lojkania enalia TaxID=147567 RepID=A0A9P4K5M8_9PLEO|nr:hypothetical protein CC78DRAFT_535669 [Didymosphaeria enalia]
MPSNYKGEEEEKVDEQVQNELKLLNQSIIDKVVQIVDDNKPTSDLWPHFRKTILDYQKKRSEILESQTLKSEPSGK